MLTLSSIQLRYRAGAELNAEEKACLEDIITSSNDLISLQSAMYLYGTNFSFNENIAKRLDRFIDSEPFPGITATCIKVMVDFWNLHETYYEHLERYVNYACYDVWYDEVIVCVSFFLRNPHLQRETIRQRLNELEREARVRKEIGLLELFDSNRTIQ